MIKTDVVILLYLLNDVRQCFTHTWFRCVYLDRRHLSETGRRFH